MGALFSVLIYLLIGILVFRRIMRVKGGEKNRTNSAAGRPVTGQVNRSSARTVNAAGVQAQPQPYRNVQRKKTNNGVNAHMAREKIDIRSWEDRKNDWLARQMEEERVCARRMSEMFQMKLEHRYNCEAEMLKQFHQAACNADGVDNGEHK